jgi:hypothetical protein
MSHLVLGWKVTPGGDPSYWLTPKRRAGSQLDKDLVLVRADAMATHSLVLAQSGSGKSFFLGRLIEELLLRTRAKCIIFDPNADFWKADEVQDAKLWTGADYNPETRVGKLPHEGRRQDFAASWSKISSRILTARRAEDSKTKQRLQVWWPDVNVELFSEDLDPVQRSQLYHCHAFVKAIAPLVDIKRQQTKRALDLIDAAERLYGAQSQIGSVMQAEFPIESLAKFAARDPDKSLRGYVALPTFLLRMLSKEQKLRFATSFIQRRIDQAIAAVPYVQPEMGRFYFAKAQEYKAAQVLADNPPPLMHRYRLEVIDLPSVPDRSTRMLVINVAMAQVWRQARLAWAAALERPQAKDERVPTFIVIDEAHNLVPADPRDEAERALREQFRTVAAEGRKYGLFLILVSQRPEKLDPLVVSECENKALMRMDSRAVLDGVVRLCGLDDIRPRVLEKCLEFGMGRVLLVGRWAGENPTVCYCAARRTTEGGRNLRPEHWTTPEETSRAGRKSA